MWDRDGKGWFYIEDRASGKMIKIDSNGTPFIGSADYDNVYATFRKVPLSGSNAFVSTIALAVVPRTRGELIVGCFFIAVS